MTERKQPRIWSTLEEFEGRPEALARRGRAEWNTKPKGFATPYEELPFTEKTLRRRDFLKLSGFGAVLAMVGCYERPNSHLMPYVVQPDEVVPGVANYYSSTDAEGNGIVVKCREGRPIKLEGNPDHPVNQGRLSANSQAQIMSLYDPDRVQGPAWIRDGQVGDEMEWAAAYQEVARKLDAARRKGVLLTPTITGPARTAFLQRFLQAFPGVRHVTYVALAESARLKAEEASYGKAVVPHYHFEKCQTVVLLGADPMAEGPHPVEHMRGLAAVRQVRVEDGVPTMGKVYAFEPIMSLSGMNADERYPVHPDDLLELALALATALRAKGATGPSLPDRNPVEVEKALGLPAGVIERMAEDLAAARGKSLVYAGGMMARTADAQALFVVANAINAMLGNDGETIDRSRPSVTMNGTPEAMLALIDEMNRGEVEVLLVADANPAYLLPQSAKFTEAMGKVPFKASFSTYLDETSLHCHMILPGTHFLESWGDAETYAGVYSLRQPAISPIWNNRQFEDSLLEIARAKGVEDILPAELYTPIRPNLNGAQGNAPAPPATTPFYQFLQNYWRTEMFGRVGGEGTDLDFWHECLRTGVIEVPQAPAGSASGTFQASALGQVEDALANRPKRGEATLVSYVMSHIGDGSNANNPWLLELPDPVSRVCWDNFAAVAPQFARKHKLQDGDLIRLTVNGVEKTVPVRIHFGAHPDVIAVAVGWGRTGAGAVGNGEGFNAFEFGRVEGEGEGRQLVFTGASAEWEKAGGSYELADVMGHNYMKQDPEDEDEYLRPIVQEVPLEYYQKDRKAPQPPHHIPYHEAHAQGRGYDSIWGEPASGVRYAGNHKWQMSIDLNLCVACNACMVACQAENNIPIVGKREVLVGREMHWIRIDRYYSADPANLDNPDVLKHPMLCQHCDTAPCETVCPVLATVHSPDGLNIMAYNRCVGTRYCSNNCPYKVRRFNWFQYQKYRKGPQYPDLEKFGTALVMHLNPDVTVRYHGIMEKCTFCVQRIQDARWEAKKNGHPIEDGSFMTACQQTCPTNAIVFGDGNDPDSRVAQIYREHAHERGHLVLEEFNFRPNVLYLSQVRNRAPRPWDEHLQGMKHHGPEHHGEGHDPEHHDEHGHDDHGTGGESGGHDATPRNRQSNGSNGHHSSLRATDLTQDQRS